MGAAGAEAAAEAGCPVDPDTSRGQAARESQEMVLKLATFVWATADEPDRCEAPVRAAVDTSRAGQLRHRYEGELHRELHRTLNLMAKARKSGLYWLHL